MIYRPMDTARFIELARAKHGSLYDYSETVYTHNQKPVSFGCTRCGKKVTLLQAQSHLNPGKLCGCRTCNRSRKRICGGCGTVVPAAEFHLNGKKCKGCKESDLRQKRLATIRKHEKQCKECGIVFSGRDKVFCSNDCKRLNAENRLTYLCCHCGRTVRKRSVSTARFQFCNKQCQNAYHANTGYCRTKKEICRRNKSRRLMRKIKAEKSDLRKSSSEGFKWWILCKRQCLHGESKIKDAWESRIKSACRLLRVRDDPVFKLTKQDFWCWDSRIAKERIGKLKSKVSSQEELKWTQRINDAAKNSYKRIKRKASRIGIHG